jgi:ectoine hydroxylase-related dioxygenase (phytanoyl-CoA dioxygenase family)
LDLLTDIESRKSYINEIEKHGVSIFRKFISAKQIETLTLEINKIHAMVMQKISGMDRPLQKHTDITERFLGRLDYRCGFTADIFAEVGQHVQQIIKNISPQIAFRYYWGVIPSLSKAGPTNWHRDVYPILNITEGVNLGTLDLNLPPYYFSVLMPLVEVTHDNGPTIFIKGSHHTPIVDETKEEIFAPLLTPGDMTIFDGRILHRGMANVTDKPRPVAYMTFLAEWYNDQTFLPNKYLFPELAISGQE